MLQPSNLTMFGLRNLDAFALDQEVKLLGAIAPGVPVPLDASSLVKIVTLCIPLTKGVKTLGATVLVIVKAKQP
jgi:hypothetical protein